MAVRNALFVDEQGVPADLEADGCDADAVHFLATDAGGNAVGTARLLADGQIGRIAVLPAFRRRGIGSRLLAAAMDAARTRGHRRVWLHAQIDAQDLDEVANVIQGGESSVTALTGSTEEQQFRQAHG